MENVDLEVEVDSDLSDKVNELALEYFGDTSDASKGRVLEVAFRMRQLWAHSIQDAGTETNEAVTKWEFSQSPVPKENDGTILNWLFRR